MSSRLPREPEPATSSPAPSAARMPWVGPQPYDVEDHAYFFGRSEELKDLELKVNNHRTCFVRGESGSGKTSLLRAGLVPLLRYRRMKSLDEGSDNPAPIVLVLRDWSHVGMSSGSLFLEAFHHAVEQYRKYPFVSREEPLSDWQVDTKYSDFTTEVRKLVQALGRCILIFDQFEEVLRIEGPVRHWAVNQLLELSRAPFAVRIVVSIREDSVKELRVLDSELPRGISDRSFFVKPMGVQASRKALQASAAQAGIDFPETAIDHIFEWLQTYDRLVHRSSGSDHHALGEVNMLLLQTLLVQTYEYAVGHHTGDKPLLINQATLDGFRARRPLEELVGNALVRWIEEAVSGPTPEEPRESVPGEFPVPEALTAVIRRIVARFGPHLSAGGFKVMQPEASVLRFGLQESLTNFDEADHVNVLQAFEELLAEKPFQIDVLYQKVFGWNISDENRSGIARGENWRGEQTVQSLVRAYDEAVRRLSGKNVLVVGRNMDESRHIELVHDSFGEALERWSKDQRDSLEDALASLSSVRGLFLSIKDFRPPAGEGPRIVDSIRWKGLFLRPAGAKARGMKETTAPGLVEHVEFKNCDFTGTVFNALTFSDVSFTGCNLTAVLFLDCEFRATGGEAGVRFEDCWGGGTSFVKPLTGKSGSMDETSFRQCRFVQPTFFGLLLRGPVRFLGSSVAMGLFEGLQAVGRSPPHVQFEEGCAVEYTAWDEDSGKLIRFHGSTVPVTCGLRGASPTSTPAGPLGRA